MIIHFSSRTQSIKHVYDRTNLSLKDLTRYFFLQFEMAFMRSEILFSLQISSLALLIMLWQYLEYATIWHSWNGKNNFEYNVETFIYANFFPRDHVRNPNEIELFQMNNTWNNCKPMKSTADFSFTFSIDVRYLGPKLVSTSGIRSNWCSSPSISWKF